jgi:hypothetical protein
MKLTDTLNLAWAGAVATAFIWITTTFATASEVDDLKLQILYGQFYDRLDDYEEEYAEGDHNSAERLRRELIRIKAKICEEDPEWDYCDEAI